MTSRGTVLVAEDNLALLKAIVTRLQGAGFSVIAVQDGYQALEQCRRGKPDIMLLDINMPAGSGLSVHERMHADPELAAIPVVYMTGSKCEVVSDRVEELGAVALIHKPIDGKQVVSLIESVLAR